MIKFTIPKTQRETLLMRDNYKCQVCGNDKSITLHHIYGRKLKSELSLDNNNLITLCKCCHEDYHKQYANITPYTFSKWLLSKTVNIRRVSVEWMNGETRNLVFYDEPPMKIKGLINNDIKLTLIRTLNKEVEMTEEQLIEYMVNTYDTNKVQVESAIIELTRQRRIMRIYHEGKTLIRIMELNYKGD